MDIVDASKESSTGLELDKIDLSDLFQVPVVEKKDQKEGKKKSKIKIPSLNIANFKIALIIGAIILSLIIVYFLWDQTIIDLPFLESGSTQRMSKRIVTVGPVMTSFGKDEHVKMTVQIECKNTKLKNKVSELDQRIQSKIMLMLNDPKARRLLRQGDFKALKPFIRKEVEQLLKNSGVIKGVYFSQINLY
jgi:flagellar basal body-associated protein FliL